MRVHGGGPDDQTVPEHRAGLRAGVAGTAATPAEGERLAAEQTYTWWNLDALKTLDPQKNTDVEDGDAIRHLFEGLMNEDAKGAMVPGVAESHTLSDDRLTYTFTLRDAKWSNGEPVTAGDFVYGWQQLVDPATASEYAWFAELANVANATEIIKGERPATDLGVRAVDDRTLAVTLTHPTPYFVKMLSHSSFFPAPRAVIEAHGGDWTKPGNLVGNGAIRWSAMTSACRPPSGKATPTGTRPIPS